MQTIITDDYSLPGGLFARSFFKGREDGDLKQEHELIGYSIMKDGQAVYSVGYPATAQLNADLESLPRDDEAERDWFQQRQENYLPV